MKNSKQNDQVAQNVDMLTKALMTHDQHHFEQACQNLADIQGTTAIEQAYIAGTFYRDQVKALKELISKFTEDTTLEVIRNE